MAGQGANQWLDADLPEVMALRRRCCRRRARACATPIWTCSHPGWWQRLGLPTQRSATPVLLVCEGVLMYLPPAQVHAVLAEFAQHAPPGSRMVLDVMTRRAVGCAARHASVRATGAEFRWGVGRMAEAEAVHPRLQLLREQSVAEGYGWPGIAHGLAVATVAGCAAVWLATLGIRE
ncbi:MAG: hypothetical protein U1E74_06310 [Paenacidovorax caeni]